MECAVSGMTSNKRPVSSEDSAEGSTRAVGAPLVSPQLLLVILFTAIAAVPLLKPGYFWNAHDARHDVYFIFEYNRSMDDGIWLARWSPDFSWGYGYPMFVIYGPLSTFVGTLLHRFVGLGFTQSAETVYGLAMLLSALGMYGYVRSWLGRNAGLLAAVAYVFIPYRLVEVYVRASMAEYVALAWLPLILWGVRSAFENSRPGDGRSLVGPLVAIALAYGALMVTSNLVALIFTPLLALYMLLLLLNRINEEQPLRRLSRQSFLPLLANGMENDGEVVGCRIDRCAHIDRGDPHVGGVHGSVIDIQSAQAGMAVGGEIKQGVVPEEGEHFIPGGVDDRAQVVWPAERLRHAFTQGHPDVLASYPSGPVRGEINDQFVLADGRVPDGLRGIEAEFHQFRLAPETPCPAGGIDLAAVYLSIFVGAAGKVQGAEIRGHHRGPFIGFSVDAVFFQVVKQGRGAPLAVAVLAGQK